MQISLDFRKQKLKMIKLEKLYVKFKDIIFIPVALLKKDTVEPQLSAKKNLLMSLMGLELRNMIKKED